MELLVRITNTPQPSVLLALKAFKAGDVIACCPDGWAWTPAELTNADYRIITAPIVQVTADALTTGPSLGTSVVAKRAYRLTLTLPVLVASIGKPRDSTERLALTALEVTAAMVASV